MQKVHISSNVVVNDIKVQSLQRIILGSSGAIVQLVDRSDDYCLNWQMGLFGKGGHPDFAPCNHNRLHNS